MVGLSVLVCALALVCAFGVKIVAERVVGQQGDTLVVVGMATLLCALLGLLVWRVFLPCCQGGKAYHIERALFLAIGWVIAISAMGGPWQDA